MELVIKIDEYVYKDLIQTGENTIHLGTLLDLRNCVRSGKPLPKGHGRLGDLDELEKEIVNGIKAGNYEEGYEKYAHINDMDDCVDAVVYADTIIEADRAERSDKE